MISIIIPCLNSAETIQACIRSLRDQTLRNFEVIIIEGASTDNTSAIISREVENDSRFAHYSSVDRGVYDAINTGIKRARGEWIYILGSDDEIYSATTLDEVTTKLGDDADFVVFEIERPDRSDSQPKVQRAIDLAGQNVCQQGLFYRKTLFDDSEGFDLRYRICADWKFNIECLALGARAANIDQVVARYSGGGLSSRVTDERFYDDLVQIYSHALRAGIFSPKMGDLRHLMLSTGRRLLKKRQFLSSLELIIAFYFHAVKRKLERFAKKKAI